MSSGIVDATNIDNYAVYFESTPSKVNYNEIDSNI